MLPAKLLLTATTLPVAFAGRLICADITRFLDHGTIRLHGHEARPMLTLQIAGAVATAAAILASPAHAILPVTLFSGIAALIAAIDHTTGIIPDRLVYPAIAGGALMAATGHSAVGLQDALIGAAGIWLVIAATSSLALLAGGGRPVGGLARGDWKLGAAIGAWLGLLPALAAFIVALSVSALLAAVRGGRVPAPFAPAFCLAALFFLVSDVFGAYR